MDAISNHADAAMARLATPLKGKANVEALVRALAARVQGLEDATLALYAAHNLDTATGARLDEIGQVVGLLRGGRTDAAYRNRLGAWIALLRSSGTPEEILRVFRMLVPLPRTVRIEEVFPAHFLLRVEGPGTTAEEAMELLGFLRRAKPAGVRAHLHWYSATPETTFTLNGTAQQALDAGRLATVQE